MHGVYFFKTKTDFSWRIHFSLFRCTHTLTHLYKVWSRVVVIITENITTKLCCACGMQRSGGICKRSRASSHGQRGWHDLLAATWIPTSHRQTKSSSSTLPPESVTLKQTVLYGSSPFRSIICIQGSGKCVNTYVAPMVFWPLYNQQARYWPHKIILSALPQIPN